MALTAIVFVVRVAQGVQIRFVLNVIAALPQWLADH